MYCKVNALGKDVRIAGQKKRNFLVIAIPGRASAMPGNRRKSNQ
jgi:hypothetical protein